MPGHQSTVSRARLSDEETLEILEMRETMTAGEIVATPLARRYGLSRSAILGMCKRVKDDTEASEHDGTMPPGWWRKRKRHT